MKLLFCENKNLFVKNKNYFLPSNYKGAGSPAGGVRRTCRMSYICGWY